MPMPRYLRWVIRAFVLTPDRFLGPVVLALLMGLAPAAAYAQPSPSATVRVKLNDNVAVIGDTGATIVGVLVRRDSSWLVVQRFDPPDTTRIAIGTIERAEFLHRGRGDGRRTMRTAVLVGAGLGAAAGYVAGIQASRSECTAYCSGQFFAALGGVAGALLGAVVGIPIAAATSDRWERFEPADVRMSATVVPRGRGVGLALRWTP
jgi:hypothetical protein